MIFFFVAAPLKVQSHIKSWGDIFTSFVNYLVTSRYLNYRGTCYKKPLYCTKKYSEVAIMQIMIHQHIKVGISSRNRYLASIFQNKNEIVRVCVHIYTYAGFSFKCRFKDDQVIQLLYSKSYLEDVVSTEYKNVVPQFNTEVDSSTNYSPGVVLPHPSTWPRPRSMALDISSIQQQLEAHVHIGAHVPHHPWPPMSSTVVLTWKRHTGFPGTLGTPSLHFVGSCWHIGLGHLILWASTWLSEAAST